MAKKYSKVNLADPYDASAPRQNNTATLPASRGKLNTVFSPSQHMNSDTPTTTAPGGPYQYQCGLNPPDTSHLSLPAPAPRHPAAAHPKHHAVPETYLVLALIVSCFFNLPFGLVAVCVSVAARRAYESGDAAGGEWRSVTSLCISLLGIFFTALLIIVIITVLLYADLSGGGGGGGGS